MLIRQLRCYVLRLPSNVDQHKPEKGTGDQMVKL